VTQKRTAGVGGCEICEDSYLFDLLFSPLLSLIGTVAELPPLREASKGTSRNLASVVGRTSDCAIKSGIIILASRIFFVVSLPYMHGISPSSCSNRDHVVAVSTLESSRPSCAGVALSSSVVRG
jgi:hypothetical protein